VAAATCWAVPSARAAAPPTHLQVQGRLVEQLTAQVLPPLTRVPQGAPLSLRSTGGHPLVLVAADSIAAQLTRRGVEVWIAPSAADTVDSMLVEGWVLDLEVDDARFVVGSPAKGLLVFGSGRSHRQASARLTAALRPSPEEPPVWTGAPSAVYVDDFDAGRAAAVGFGMPSWMTEALAGAPKEPSAKSGWVERLAVVGMIGGVVLIYAAGAN
jgi:hypothetical protein